MNKSELVEVAAREAGITKPAADKALSAFIGAVVQTVTTGESVTLVGFGTFKSAKRAARTGKNPKTGATLKIPATTVRARCQAPSCIHPVICSNLDTSHKPLTEIYKKVDALPDVKKAYVGSGVRCDLLVNDFNKNNQDGNHDEYLEQLVTKHVCGRLKVAPEHTGDATLKIMRKPSFRYFKKFKEKYDKIQEKHGLKQPLIPYFISSHPGTTEEDMANLAAETKDLGFRLEQVQDFTPTPMTVAWDLRDADYRLSFRADRNLHWFMDSPVHTNTPSYKQGFTPGDNFVHKPETGDPALLRRLGVRYVVGTGTTPPPGGTRVAQFGEIHVFELADPEPLAHLEGPGQLSIETPALAGEGLRVRVSGATEASTRLVLHVAGYPRWQLRFTPDGGATEPVEWFEVPVLGDSPIATQAQRPAGELRGGKALGDDGHEPTLIAAPARDGTNELHYDRWRRADILGLGLTLAGLALLALLARSRPLLTRLHPWARRLRGRRAPF